MGGFFVTFVIVAKKKKLHITRYILLCMLAMACIFVYKYRGELQYVYYNLYPPAIYAGFGTSVPKEYNILGVDVSRYQKHINWTALSDMEHNGRKLSFAYIKATEGYSLKDPLFDFNALSGKKSRLYVGAYHFYRFNVAPESQVEFFYKNIKDHQFTLAPVIDVETEDNASSEKIRTDLSLALQILENRMGIKPIIYTNPSFYKKHLEGHFDTYSFWLAHYYVNKPLIPAKMQAKYWQLTDKATVDGIKAPVDLNVFLGTPAEFQTFIQKQ